MQHLKDTEIIKSNNPLQESFAYANSDIFPAIMDVLVNDMKFLKEKYGEDHKYYKNKLNMFTALSKYQLDALRYVKCLEHEIVNLSAKVKVMSTGYRKVADMKVNELIKLTSKEIEQISTLPCTGNKDSKTKV